MTVAPAVLRQAIAWLVEERSGSMPDSRGLALQRWRQADPAHEAAWLQVTGALARTLQPLGDCAGPGLTADAATDALVRAAAPSRRRVVGGTLVAFAGAALAAFVIDRFTPVATLWADVQTATGERRSLSLPDGGTLLLDARSAADLSFDATQRLVRLREGAVIATVSADAAARPFIVQTRHGEARALGTRYMVRAGEGHTEVAALQHSVALRTRDGAEATLAEGDTARMTGQGAIETSAASAAGRAAWQSGMLAVTDGALGDVVAALRAYRRGMLRVSPAAAQLRVLGTFPLDDTDLALKALADTLPITVERYRSGWMVVIDVKPGAPRPQT